MADNKTKTLALQINGISQSIKGTKALKEVLEAVTGELEYWKKADMLAPLFKDYASLTKGWDNDLQKLLPKLEIANKFFKTTSQIIKEVAAATKIAQLKPLIADIEEVAKQYSQAEKYTKDIHFGQASVFQMGTCQS